MFKLLIVSFALVSLGSIAHADSSQCTADRAAQATVKDLNQHGAGSMFEIVEVSTPRQDFTGTTNWTAVTIVKSLDGTNARSAVVSTIDNNACEVRAINSVALAPYQN